METTRRYFIKRAMAVGAVTIFAPEFLLGCEEIGEEVNNLTPKLPDLDKLMETLKLAEGHFITNHHTGHLYQIDQEAHTIAQIGPSGDATWTYGGVGEADDELNHPTTLHPQPDGSIYVVDSGNARIVQLDDKGKRLRTISSPDDEAQGVLRAAIIDDDGHIWATDPHTHKVHGLKSDGSPLRSFGELGAGATQINGPRGIAIDARGHLHVVDAGNARIQVFERSGAHVRSYGEYGQGDGRHITPRSIAIAPNSLIYVSDPLSGAVQVYDKEGKALARLDDLKLAGKPAIPLDVSFQGDDQVQVRLYSWVEA